MAAAAAPSTAPPQTTPTPARAPAAADPTSPPQDEGDGSSPASSRRPRVSMPSLPRGAGGVVNDGAGLVLAFFAWTWIGLPFLQGGVTGVKNVLRAKFFNKDSKGNWLP